MVTSEKIVSLLKRNITDNAEFTVSYETVYGEKEAILRRITVTKFTDTHHYARFYFSSSQSDAWLEFGWVNGPLNYIKSSETDMLPYTVLAAHIKHWLAS